MLLSLTLVGADCSRDSRPQAAATRPAVTAAQPVRSDAGLPPHLQVDSEPIAAADENDAPDAPRALPRSGRIADWVKTRPIRILPADQAATLDDPQLAHAMSFYRLARIAHCAYTAGDATVEVRFIEAPPEGAADAFGLFSLLAAEPRPLLRPDGSMRGRRRDAAHIRTAWQGSAYVEIVPLGDADPGDGADAAGGAAPATNRTTPASLDRAMEQLMDRIIFALPSAEPPLLARIIPADRRERCRVWHVRTTRALTLLELPGLSGLDPAVMDERLELGDDVMLSLAAIEVVPGAPHLIWLVGYSTPAAAQAVYTKWTASAMEERSALHEATEVRPPRDRYLAGTWTRRQESLQPLLPVLLPALPQPLTTAPSRAVSALPATAAHAEP